MMETEIKPEIKQETTAEKILEAEKPSIEPTPEQIEAAKRIRAKEMELDKRSLDLHKSEIDLEERKRNFHEFMTNTQLGGTTGATQTTEKPKLTPQEYAREIEAGRIPK